MHSVTDLYRTLLADKNHRVETKLIIAGVEYGQADIVANSLRIYGGLYSTFGIGNCCSRQIEFQIFPKGDIPRQAQIQVFVRLVVGDQASEWIPKGVFFFATRRLDKKTGVLSVNGYDAMLKSEETWLDNSYASETFPMPVETAVNDIASRMGVSVDSRTVLDSAFPVQYPVDDEGDMTMREALSRIAIANAGNWVISDDGELLLVGLNSVPAQTNLGRSIQDFSPGIESKPITKVELLDENGDIVGVAGTDSGKTLTAQNPDGTNEMAQAILAKVSGYTHIGYEGQNAMIDPAAEIGDAVTVSGHYVPIVSTDSIFDSLLAVNISAPDADELDDEYPYKSKTQRQIERNMAVTRSLITKSAEEINLEIQGVDGRVSALQLTLDGVTITGSDGVTRINGGMIQANSVTATQIDATNLKVEAANITGTLTASQIQTSSIYVGNLADGNSYATKTYVLNNAGLSASEVNNAIATYIDGTSITAEKLRGRTVDLLASATQSIGSIELVYTSTGYGIAINTSYGGIKLQSAGNIFLSAGSGGNLTLQNNTLVLGQCNILLSNNSFGTSAPSGAGSSGQLYFQLVG